MQELVGTVLSPQFVRCLAANLGNSSGLLHNAARNCLATFNKLAGRDDDDRLRLQIVTSVLGAERHFDQLAKTRFVAIEISRLRGEAAVAQHAGYLGGIFARHAAAGGGGGGGGGDDDGDELEAAGKGQIWAVEQLYGERRQPQGHSSLARVPRV